MSIKEVVQIDFETQVVNADKTIVVYFWKTNCPSCKMMSPQIEALSQESNNRFELVKVNIAEQMELAEKYDIMSTPTVMVFKPGQKPKTAYQGFAAKGWLLEVLNNYV